MTFAWNGIRSEIKRKMFSIIYVRGPSAAVSSGALLAPLVKDCSFRVAVLWFWIAVLAVTYTVRLFIRSRIEELRYQD
jgi:hypothetical protein